MKSSVEVLMTFGHMVQPFIGGNQCVKCVVDDGDVDYIRDVGSLLQFLDIQHPVGQHLVRVCRAFIKQHHAGAATLLFFIRSFARVAASLIEQGLEKRHVDMLMHAALEECIQHCSVLAVKINVPDPGRCCLGSGLPGCTSLKVNCGKSLDNCKTSFGCQAEAALKVKLQKTRKKKEKTTNKTHLDAKSVASKPKGSACCMNDTKTKSTDRHNKSNSTGKLVLNVVTGKLKDGDHVTDIQSEVKKVQAEADHSEYFDRSDDKVFRDVCLTKIPEETSAEQDRADDITIVELKMKNLKKEDENSSSEDTDWFFESPVISDSHNSTEAHDNSDPQSSVNEKGRNRENFELEQAKGDEYLLDKSEKNVNVKDLKDKWDTDLINDIKELKFGIENDLKIVSERRQKMNEKLARYIKFRPECDTVDEFDDCFDGLQNKVHVVTVSDQNSENENSNDFDEFSDVVDTENSNLPQNDMPDKRGCLGQTGLGEETGFEVLQDKGIREGISSTQNDCIPGDIKSYMKQNQKITDSGASEKTFTPSTANFMQQKFKVNNKKMSEQKTNAKADLHNIDSLLKNIGIASDGKKGLSVKKLGRNSRHIAEVELDVQTTIDKLPSDLDTVDTGMPKESPVAVGIDSADERRSLDKEMREGEEDKCSDARTFKDKVRDNQLWSYKLIRGLCPQTDKGVTEVVNKLVLKQLGVNTEKPRPMLHKVDTSMIHCHSKVGVLPRKPQLVDGVIVSTTADNLLIVQQWTDKPCRLLIVNGDIQPNYHHKGYKKIANTTGVGGVQFLTDPVTQSDQWLADVKMVLRKHDINIVMARGLVCEEVQLLCLQEHIVLMEMVPYKTMETLADACQVDMVTYITLASETNICVDVAVFPWIPDWMDKSQSDRYEVVLKVSATILQLLMSVGARHTLDYFGPDTIIVIRTVVFSELTSDIASLKEQEFWDCLYLVTSVLKSGQVLPGAGRTEASCIKFCLDRAADERRQSKDNCSGTYLATVFDELSYAFKDYVDTYSVNVGIDKEMIKENIKYMNDTLVCRSEMQMREETRRAETVCVTETVTEISGTIIQESYDNQSVSACQGTEKSLLSHTRKVDHNLDESLVAQSDLYSNLDEELQAQSVDCDNSCNYLDDYVTKLAAWRTALDTVFLILSIDSFIQTGLTDENVDNKVHSAL